MSTLFKDPDELKSLIPNYRKDELELLREVPEFSDLYESINDDLEKMIINNSYSVPVMFRMEYERKTLDLVESVLSLNGWVCKKEIRKRDSFGDRKVVLIVFNPFYKEKRKS